MKFNRERNMKEDRIKFCTSGNPWSKPNDQATIYLSFIKFYDRRIAIMKRSLEAAMTALAIESWKNNNPARKIPGSDRTARLRKKRRKALGFNS
jgi:hypothetical protein